MKGYERNYRDDIQLRSEYYITIEDKYGRRFAVRRGDEVVIYLKNGQYRRGIVQNIGTKHITLSTVEGSFRCQWDNADVLERIVMIHSR